ncbi:MAG: hypothetical protein HOP33_06320 [Verrucomicrobia bacterium]|nr:hypothetical protein [Verrucomicrobiota bacterium]
MPNPIVALVDKEMAAFRELQLAHPSLFPDNNTLYPIPFFGDIRRAEVVTLALNPAHPEFVPERRWPIGCGSGSLTAVGLTNRLLSYFDSPRTRRHQWFDVCEQGLAALGCSYQTNAAHVDVHPFPTKFARHLNQNEKRILGEVIKTQSPEHMLSVLGLCNRVKLIVVIRYALPSDVAPTLTTFEFVRDRLSPLAGLVDTTGHEPPLLDAGSHAGIVGFLHQHQARLNTFLHTAPTMILSP